MSIPVPLFGVSGVSEIADFFLVFADGSVEFVPAPRINLAVWMKFWRVMTASPEKAGFRQATAAALESAMVVSGVSLDTLTELHGSLDAIRQKQADKLREEVLAERARMVPLIDIMLKTDDPSALAAGVLAPLLHGEGSIMNNVATLANQVSQLAPEVHWQWGGVFEGVTTLQPDPWNIYSGLGKKLSEMLVQFDEAAPGEPKTWRDRATHAGREAVKKAKKRATQGGLILALLALVFVGGALWESRR